MSNKHTQMRQDIPVSRRNLLLGISSAILVFSLTGCRHLTWWNKKDPAEGKTTYKSPNREEEEQMGKMRNGEFGANTKKKQDSFFYSDTAKQIDANLGGSRE